MEAQKFQQSLLATMTAFTPVTAVRTSEVDTVISETLNFALTAVPEHRDANGKTAKVFVWRMSEGFREYNLYIPMNHVDTDKRGLKIVDVEGPDDPDLQMAIPQKSRDVIEVDDDESEGLAADALNFIEGWNCEEDGPAIFILRDFHYFLNPTQGRVPGEVGEMEGLVDFLLRISEGISGMALLKQVIIPHSTSWNVPSEMDNYVHRVKVDTPNKEHRLNLVRLIRDGIKQNAEQKDRYPAAAELSDEITEEIADAGAGLTHIQFENLLCMDLAIEKTMSAEYILREKAKLVEQAGFKLITPRVTFDEVGGLEPLKTWARRRKRRFTDAAFEYGFRRYPRGALLAGVPGCGKSLLAKATAKEWGMNIIAVRAPDLKGSLVGESEEKTQKLLDMAEANGPCIVFVDEAEKLLGSQDSVRDGGAHDAVMAQFLSFMQDNEAGVYFIFTANNMNKFPPELIDRFEGRWFVDLPSADERESIANIHLTLNAGGVNGLLDIANDEESMTQIVKMSDGYSGRNIEQAIEEAMDIAFDDGKRAVSIDDLKTVFGEMKPTSETKKAEIEAMREFVGNGTMRQANTPTEGGDAVVSMKAHRGFA
tara:strand:- start:2196 stop:3980 length:1785 start_codon:yes stop_codon:yes gene_type:complete